MVRAMDAIASHPNFPFHVFQKGRAVPCSAAGRNELVVMFASSLVTKVQTHLISRQPTSAKGTCSEILIKIETFRGAWQFV